MKTPHGTESIDRTVERTNEWLVELGVLLNSEGAEDTYAVLRSVLHALRERLPLMAGVRLAAQLPTLLRGVYYEGWQPDRGHVHTRSLGEFLALVERESIHGAEISAEDKARAVFHLLASRIEAAEVDRVLSALPLNVQELFPRPRAGGIVSVTPARPTVRHALVPAKSA